nr:discoidin domain-containing protein [Cellulomonas hominis]
MSTVSTVLADRGDPEPVPTGADFVHGLTFPTGADGTTLTALWTSDVRTEVAISTAADATVTLTDVYGGRTELALVGGQPTGLPVSGAPLYLTAPAGTDLTVDAGVGADLLAAGGATASASSTAEGSEPAGVLGRTGGWTAAASRTDGTADIEPWIQVDLPVPTTLDAVYVESAGIRCCSAGLRDYTVSVRADGDRWMEVAEVTGQFLDRGALLRFDAVQADAVRIQVPTRTERGLAVADLNYSGQTAGLHPAWVPLATTDGWTASVVSVQAFGPG